MRPPFYIQPPPSLVVIFSYTLPSNFPIPLLQIIIAQSLIKEHKKWVACADQGNKLPNEVGIYNCK